MRLDNKVNNAEKDLSGKIMNLLSNDVNRFEYACFFFMDLWRAPIEGVIAIYIMYINIGVSCLIGVAFVLIFIPFQGNYKILIIFILVVSKILI